MVRKVSALSWKTMKHCGVTQNMREYCLHVLRCPSVRPLTRVRCCRTKWKRQTTAAMRSEQLRSHACDEKDCPGARRLSLQAAAVAAVTSHVPGSVPASSPVSIATASFCRQCCVLQALQTADRCETAAETGAAADMRHLAGHVASSPPPGTPGGHLLPRLFLGGLQLPFGSACCRLWTRETIRKNWMHRHWFNYVWQAHTFTTSSAANSITSRVAYALTYKNIQQHDIATHTKYKHDINTIN